MKRKRLPVFLRPAEATRLMDAADTRRNRLLIQCGLLLGLRVSELSRLNVEDVDIVSRQVFVRLAKGGKQRFVPIPEALIDELAVWIGKRTNGPVFPSRKGGRNLSTRAIRDIVTTAGENAALLKHVHPHVLRHSYATRLLDTGAALTDIQELLGHESIQTTSIYLHCSSERLKGVVDRL